MGLTYPSNKICPRCGTGGYVWYMDNSEFIAKCTNCGHYFRKDEFPLCVLDGETKTKQTNADRIRAMTDKELAKIIVCQDNRLGDDCFYGNCDECTLDWLKQEVADNE